MKTWKIEIKAPDEHTALQYLNMLRTQFGASVVLKEDMKGCVIQDTEKKESLLCRLYKNMF